MTSACIISGSLVDAKNVGLHKSLRLIIDVPQERAMEVIEKLGWPTMANPIPVAVARMSSPAATEDTTAPTTAHDTSHTQEPAPEVQPHNPKPSPVRALRNYPRQSAMLCDKPSFWLFCRENGGNAVKCKDSAADYVRHVCQVESRADIKPGTPAENRWNLLHSAFIAWDRAVSVGAA